MFKKEKKRLFECCSSKFAYDTLLQGKNGEAKQSCYDRILSVIREYYDTPVDMTKHFYEEHKKRYHWQKDTADFFEFGLTREEACEAYYAVLEDYPMAFFIYTYKVGGYPEGGTISPLVDYEFRLGGYRKSMVDLTEDSLRVDFEQIETGTAMETARNVYNYICSRTSYDHMKGTTTFIDIPSHSVIGYVRNGSLVCEGFARTYQAFLNYFNIPCIKMSGYLKNNSTPHAWNMIHVDGAWHIVDLAPGASSGAKFLSMDRSNYILFPKDNEENHRFFPKYHNLLKDFA